MSGLALHTVRLTTPESTHASGNYVAHTVSRAALFAALCALAGWSSTPATANNDGAFLDRHWARPLKAQGKPPAGFSAQEASLDSSSCAECHRAQFDDWKASLHSRAMGPGVLGQLLDMDPEAADEHQACLRCHAPLAEQASSLKDASRKRRGGGLHEQGLVCAGCHVRGHARYGPPRRDGSTSKPGERLPHGGWQASAAFSDSRFCAACHQFDADGFALNGKPLENTYEEWRASRHAREGRTCQSCHMPDRRHLWRGIHDAETVRGGVTMETQAPTVASGRITARLRLANTGTGHAFPTYVTPLVEMEIFQADVAGRPLAGTRRAQWIGRRVALDLSREIADTRLPPDEAAVLAYAQPAHPNAAMLVYRVRVEPDAFYAAFYRDALRQGATRAGRKMIEQALAAANASAYTLFERREQMRGQ